MLSNSHINVKVKKWTEESLPTATSVDINRYVLYLQITGAIIWTQLHLKWQDFYSTFLKSLASNQVAGILSRSRRTKASWEWSLAVMSLSIHKLKRVHVQKIVTSYQLFQKLKLLKKISPKMHHKLSTHSYMSKPISQVKMQTTTPQMRQSAKGRSTMHI